MLGVGLGGFVEGMERGFGLRQQIDENNLRREELQRAKDERARIDAINAETNEAFDAAVQSGEFDPGEFDKFWIDYALPRMTNELLVQGDYEQARALREWGESDAAKEGGRLFASAIFKAQTGDHAGALQDVISAGQLDGYIDHNFELLGQDTLTDPDGNVVGYRLRLKDGNGEELEQDIAIGDLPQLISVMANPEAAWQTQQAAQAAAAASEQEREQELEDYERRKQIDQEYSTTNQPDPLADRQTAIDTLRERMDGGPLSDQPAFDDLPREEQERLIQTEIDLQTGTTRPVAPSERMIVDTESGQPVAPSAAAAPARQRAIGLGQSGKQSKAPIGEPTQKRAPSPGIAAAAQRQPKSVPGAQPANRAALEDRVAQMMVEGTPAPEIAQQLTNAGIKPNQFPQQLQQKLGRAA